MEREVLFCGVVSFYSAYLALTGGFVEEIHPVGKEQSSSDRGSCNYHKER